MEHSQTNAYLATECGYFPTFRYSPETDKLTLDSTPNFEKYNDFLMTENRYANLKQINKKDCDTILKEQQEWAEKRYKFYKNQEESN